MQPEAPENPAAVAPLIPLQEKYPAAVVEAVDALGEHTFVVKQENLVEVARYLKQSESFERLSSVTAVDWWPREPRFEVVYHLHSVSRNLRVRLKVHVSAEAAVDSLTVVWRSANWYEREVFDLFGITFRDHPSLERIMMPVDFEGHPLRKDFPVHGYKYSYRDE